MPWNDHSGPVPPRAERELLALVHEKARALAERRRRRLGVATASAVLLVAGLATVVARTGTDSSVELRTAGNGASAPAAETTTSSPTTAPAPAPTVGPTSTLAAPPPVPSTSVASTTTTRPPPTTMAPTSTTTTSTTALLCRNSRDPACGPFRWDPPPGAAQPLTVKVTASPGTIKAGGTVSFHVVVDDPDGGQIFDHRDDSNDYGDGTPVIGIDGHIDCVAMYGPWTPPDPVPVHVDVTFQHVYARAGTYTATFPYKTLGDCAHPPSQGTGTATVTVTP